MRNSTFRIGDHIVMRQDFNATCGTVQSIDDVSMTAVLCPAFDVFGQHDNPVRVPLAHCMSLGHEPRTLSLMDALSLQGETIRESNTAAPSHEPSQRPKPSPDTER
jgi:hypothetical protein